MPRETLEEEIDRTEKELLGSTGDSRKTGQQPVVELKRQIEDSTEVFVPRTRYRYSYSQPERLSTSEARRRRIQGVLAEERRRSYVTLPTPSVSGQNKFQTAFSRSAARAADPRQGAQINPRTIFGTEAHTYVSEGLRRHFLTPILAIPCVQRVVRREVMFAKRKAGRGHRVPHVRALLSHIGC